jgi:hypothetical protein
MNHAARRNAQGTACAERLRRLQRGFQVADHRTHFGKARRGIEHWRDQKEGAFDAGEGARQRFVIGEIRLREFTALCGPVPCPLGIADDGTDLLAHRQKAVRDGASDLTGDSCDGVHTILLLLARWLQYDRSRYLTEARFCHIIHD